MSEKMGIKESKELLCGLEVIAMIAAKALKDGKIGLSDFPVLMDAIKDLDKVVQAVKGLKLIDDEIKDIDGEELKELGTLVIGMVAKVKAEIDAK